MFRIFFCGGLRPPASGPGFFYIEDSSGNRFMLNGIQELPATVFFLQCNRIVQGLRIVSDL